MKHACKYISITLAKLGLGDCVHVLYQTRYMIDAHLRRQEWSPRFHGQCSSVGGGAGKQTVPARRKQTHRLVMIVRPTCMYVVGTLICLYIHTQYFYIYIQGTPSSLHDCVPKNTSFRNLGLWNFWICCVYGVASYQLDVMLIIMMMRLAHLSSWLNNVLSLSCLYFSFNKLEQGLTEIHKAKPLVWCCCTYIYMYRPSLEGNLLA